MYLTPENPRSLISFQSKSFLARQMSEEVAYKSRNLRQKKRAHSLSGGPGSTDYHGSFGTPTIPQISSRYK